MIEVVNEVVEIDGKRFSGYIKTSHLDRRFLLYGII